MPKRTTPLQAMVHLLRTHLAGEQTTVTESVEWPDGQTGEPREVDIVAETVADGEPVVLSFEVRERGRPADVTWVEQEIGKHEHLPTHKLFLVSSSGFTKGALAKVAAHSGRVVALTPNIVEVDGEAVVRRLYVDQHHLTPLEFRAVVLTPALLADPDPQPSLVALPGDIGIYNEDGTLRGTLAHLAIEVLGLPQLGRRLAVMAHNRDDRDDLKSFEVQIPLPQLGYHLKDEEHDEYHLLALLDVRGAFRFDQAEIALTEHQLGSSSYSSAQATVFDKPTVWVATGSGDDLHILWRAVDGKPIQNEATAPPSGRLFTELDTLTFDTMTDQPIVGSAPDQFPHGDPDSDGGDQPHGMPDS